MKIGNHDTHPLADVFPAMDEFALAGLTDDIKANGLQDDIVLTQDGRILDGRNRYAACIAAGVEPRFVTYHSADLDAMARYVVSKNMARRDLDPGQRALCARRLLKLCRVRKQRSVKQPDLPGVQATDAAHADDLLKGGCDELVAAVDAGEIPLEHAAAAAALTEDEQRRFVERVRVVRSRAVDLSSDDMDALRSAYDALGEHPACRVLERMVGEL